MQVASKHCRSRGGPPAKKIQPPPQFAPTLFPRVVPFFLTFALLIAPAVISRSASAQRAAVTYGISLDNDAYNFWRHPAFRPDEQYTNGAVISHDGPGAPRWAEKFLRLPSPCHAESAPKHSCVTQSLSLGQQLYTPHLLRLPYSFDAWESERPFAAVLELNSTVHIIRDRRSREVSLVGGVTGDPALGRLAQTVAHRLNSKYTRPVHGWDTQVGFEPVVMLGVRERVMPLRLLSAGSAVFDLTADAGLGMGNLRSSADVGSQVRLGWRISHPWDTRTWVGRSPLEFGASAGLRGEYVARDITLDGTMLSGGRRVERTAGVWSYQFGVWARAHALTAGWSTTTRSRTYTTGPRFHTFSNLSASWTIFR